jgi:hypothetical protein
MDFSSSSFSKWFEESSPIRHSSSTEPTDGGVYFIVGSDWFGVLLEFSCPLLLEAGFPCYVLLSLFVDFSSCSAAASSSAII